MLFEPAAGALPFVVVFSAAGDEVSAVEARAAPGAPHPP